MGQPDAAFPVMDLSISVDRTSAVRIRVAGEIDLSNFNHFVESVTLHAPDDGAWILDMCGVTYVDTTAIRALLALRERFGEIFAIVPSARLLRILEVAGLRDAFRWIEIAE